MPRAESAHDERARSEPLLPSVQQDVALKELQEVVLQEVSVQNNEDTKNTISVTANKKEKCKCTRKRNCMRKFCDADVKDKCRNTCKTICNVLGACMCFSITIIILFKFMELGIKYQN